MQNKNTRILPIFIPHLGCPHQCLFCDQHTIAGTQRFCFEDAEQALSNMLASRPSDSGGEIAFFGGSFTGIDRSLMLRLLTLASHYVSIGSADGIRLSTRPDYIDEEILTLLSTFPVRTIELGIQSLSDPVLLASGRGHTASDSIRACRLIKRFGFSLVGQMMVGLPESTPEDEALTARLLCEEGIDASRIYPTVVFPTAPLASLAKEGKYTPLSEEQAITRCANLLDIFLANHIPVIRIGLCSSDEVRASGYGFHDAIGELCGGELYRRRIAEFLSQHPTSPPASLILTVSRGHTSLAVGHRRTNAAWLSDRHRLRLKVFESDVVSPYQPQIRIEEPKADFKKGKKFS